jgi:hypothetical protein
MLFPEYKKITEVGPVPGPLKFSLRLKTFVMRGYGIESAVQTDMKIAAACRTGGFSRKKLVNCQLFFA